MDTDSLYLALSEEKFQNVILSKKRAVWDQLRSKDCTDIFTANATDNFFPRFCCNAHKRHKLDVQKCCARVTKSIVAMIERVICEKISVATD